MLELVLEKNKEEVLVTERLFLATNGEASKAKTVIKIAYDEKSLNLHFECHNDDFVDQNFMTVNNDDLYNQEVFEVFISPGLDDPKRYLEIELNPNNALWASFINNPTLGKEMQTLEKMIETKQSGIEHSVVKFENSWKGSLKIPFELNGVDANNNFRLNFYRILLKEGQSITNWVSNDDNCEFSCWQSTLSAEKSAFHRPKMFGKLHLA